MDAVIEYTLQQKGNENIGSVNAVVGETNDGYLNDIRGRHVSKENVLSAIKNAKSGRVAEGVVGAGTGTVCFGFKGGVGTSSRKLPASLGGYTVGVLVQTNFGGVLQINGAPVGKVLGKFDFSNQLLNNVDGSCMIVVATDAPLDHRNLMRPGQTRHPGIGKNRRHCLQRQRRLCDCLFYCRNSTGAFSIQQCRHHYTGAAKRCHISIIFSSNRSHRRSHP